jgi:putative membrane protein
MLEIVIFFFLGILVGTLTGLIPGIHINLVALALITTFPYLLEIQIASAIIFIASMAITHTFVDFIPSIFLGAPEEDTALSILPGHEFLIKGYGHEAVQLTIVGSLISIALLIIILPTFFFLIPIAYPFIEKMMAFFLIWISIFLIIGEKNSKIESLIIFLLAGFLGMTSINLDINEPLLPLLSGLFGSSTLIYSMRKKTKVPEQIIEKIDFQKKDLVKPAITTALVSPICSFFPGLGSSQAAIIGSQISGRLSKEQFLILLGSINTLVMSVSFTTLLLIDKSRTGAANAIQELTNLTTNTLLIILATIFLASIIASFITFKFSKLTARNIHKIDYSKISLTIIIFLVSIITYLSGIFGLIVFITSTILGLTCIEFHVRKGFLMGALLIPTILFYLPF